MRWRATLQNTHLLAHRVFTIRYPVKGQLDAKALGQLYCFNTTNQGPTPIHERAWFVDKELAGGGAVMDHTVHLADILRWFLHSEVVEVYAQANHILYAD